MTERFCKVFNCNKPVTNWRWQCCCRSHNSIYSAKLRHGTVGLETKPKDHAYYRRKAIERQERIKRATPPWANKSLIKEIYDRAHQLTVETGEMHEVDHVIPLQGKLICGLHVETNLKILTFIDNRTKGNKWLTS